MTNTTDVLPSAPKSIVNPKYRGKYTADSKDWLARMLDDEATATKQVKVTKPNPENPDEKITMTEDRPAGTDIDALFTIARYNNLDVTKYAGKADTNGFPGRFRMSVGNMLRRVIRQRHGLYNVYGDFVDAPTDFLAQVAAPDAPTHDQEGNTIPKPAKPAAEAAAA